MNNADYSPKEMLALLGINPDNLFLPMLVARKDLIKDQKSMLEELASRVKGMQGLMDLEGVIMDIEGVIGELNNAIRQRSIGNEASIVYDTYDNAVYLNREGKLRLVRLTPTERAVLKYLMQHPGERLKLSSIANGADLRDGINISYYIREIRLKLGDTNPYQPKYIQIEGGIKDRTYMFIVPQNESGAMKHH